MKNILITGANGQLGKSLQKISNDFRYNYFFTTKSQLDITQFEQIDCYVSDKNIDIIINCAAYTDVEKAEDDFDLANNINHLAVKNLALISKKQAIQLIHISTDYVFDGYHSLAYLESDKTNPINNYGITKLKGEQAIQSINPKGAIIRTSWLYSEFNSNFVKTMLRLGAEKDSISVIDNQIGAPTQAEDLARTLLTIIPKINTDTVQIYHYTNQGQCSWFEFAKEIMRYGTKDCIVKPINSKHYPTKAKRPQYSLLDTTKIQQTFQITIPFWKEALEMMLKK